MILGVDHVITGTYPDGKLPEYEKQLVDSICHIIEQYKPSVVVTFPPHGISGHRDHQAIQRATYQAVKAMDHIVEQLYYVTVVGRPDRYGDPIENIDIVFTFTDEEAKKCVKRCSRTVRNIYRSNVYFQLFIMIRFISFKIANTSSAHGQKKASHLIHLK